jgi:hypothetical protein
MSKARELIAEMSEAKELKISPIQIENAVDAKSFGWVELHPKDFLALTTPDDEHLEMIKSNAKDVDFYNKAGSIVHPFLWFDLKSGKVDGHEGRHRAAAVLNSGGKTMKVALVAFNKSGARDLLPEKLPSKLKGQFRSVSVTLPKHNVWETDDYDFMVSRVKADRKRGFA